MKNREIEYKFIVDNVTNINRLARFIDDIVIAPKEGRIVGANYDKFWTPGNCDFIRLRKNDHNKGLLTLKDTDLDTIVDRVEIETPVDFTQTESILTYIHGKPALRLKKSYIVWEVGNGLIVSIYKVTNYPNSPVFMEVEGPRETTVATLSAELIRTIEQSSAMRFTQSLQSLFQIFTKEKFYADVLE